MPDIVSACPSPTGGSLYFPGANILKYGASADWDLSSQMYFQVNWWAYQLPSEKMSIRLFQVGDWPVAGFGLSFEGEDISSGRRFLLWQGDGNSYQQIGSTFPPDFYLNQWCYWSLIATAFDDGQGNTRKISLYVHGQYLYSIYDNPRDPVGATDSLAIGGQVNEADSAFYIGNMTNFLWMNGDYINSEVETDANFTPPTSPFDPGNYGTEVKLLLLAANANDVYADGSQSARTPTQAVGVTFERAGPYDIGEQVIITDFPFEPDFDYNSEPSCDCLVTFSGFTAVDNDSAVFTRSNAYVGGPYIEGTGFQLHWRGNEDVLPAGTVLRIEVTVEHEMADPYYWLQISKQRPGHGSQVAYAEHHPPVSGSLTLEHTVMSDDEIGGYHYEFSLGSVNGGRFYSIAITKVDPV